MKRRNKKRARPLMIILITALAAVFCFSAYKVAETLLAYRDGDRLYAAAAEGFTANGEEVAETPPGPETPSQSGEGTGSDAPPEETVLPTPGISVDFEALREINEDVIGWLYIDDSKINYPLMAGVDNFKYLDSAYTGEYSSMGSLFLDYRNTNDFSDFHSVIYGHNMKNGSMFGGLKQYKAQEFFEAHRNFYIYAPGRVNVYEIFSVYTTDAYGFTYDFEFSGEEEKTLWLDKVTQASVISSELEATADDSIVVLSTCTSVSKNQRFVVIGKLLSSYDENSSQDGGV